MSRQKVFLIFSVVALIFLFFASSLARSFWSVLVVTELLNFDSRGWLETFTAAPRLREVSYRGPQGNVKADLYLPPPGRKGASV